jgi:catechol 2,3-dioxygenase-like lactoylglutathione lyase family enzyme
VWLRILLLITYLIEISGMPPCIAGDKPMPQVLGIDHIAFAAHDLEATCVFYDRLFGARTHFNYAPEGKSLVRPIALGGALLSIHQVGNGLDLVAKHPTVGGADICLRWSGDADGRSLQATADAVDAHRGGCDDAPAIVPLHVEGHGAKAKLAGDGSALCLPFSLGRFYRTNFKYPEATPPPGLPGCSSCPLRFAARQGRSAPRAGPSYGPPGQPETLSRRLAVRRRISK